MEAEVASNRAGSSEPRVLSSFRTHLARRDGFIAPVGLVLSFTLLGLALRLTRLDFQPLWWDEGYSVWFATHSLGDMIRLTAEDIHPPLYYALLHAWTLIAGAGPVSLRLVSVAAGVAAIPLTYGAASRILSSRRAGLLAAFLLTINPLHIYYSQEVRMYGLVALWSLGVMWAGWGVLRARPGRWPVLAYIALATLALYTQYYAIFLPLGLTLYALWHWRRMPKGLLRWFALQGVVALLYLPWVIFAGPRLTLYVSQKVVMDADSPLGFVAYAGRHLSAFIVGHVEGVLGPWWPLALLLLVPVALGLFMTARRSGALRFLAAILLVALFLGWLIGLRYPFFPDRGERLLVLALPAFVMLAAAGIDALAGEKTSEAASYRGVAVVGRDATSVVSPGRPWLAYSILALFVVASGLSLAAFYTVPRYAADDYRPLVARSVEQGLPGDTVFAVYPWQVGYWRSYAASVDGPVAALSPTAEWGPDAQAALDEALARGRVWFPAHLSLGAILETQAENYLASRAIPFANTWYGPGTRLSAWQASVVADRWVPDSGSTPIAWYEAPSGAQLDLTDAVAPSGPTPAANSIAPLTLAWRAKVAPPDLAVSVRLVDDLNQIWAQNDYEPLGRAAGSAESTSERSGWRALDRLGLLVPGGTPPGHYQVELVVWPKDSRRPLVGHAREHNPGSEVRLFGLEVTPADRTLTPARLPISQRQSVDLDDGVRFLGYTIEQSPLIPGELRRVNLFWQAAAQPHTDYTAFIQLLGKDGRPVAAWEAPPGAAYPTSHWRRGTLIRTQASLRAGAEVADGQYLLIAGLYQTGDGERLRTVSGKDALDLGSLTIKGRPHEMDAARAVPASAEPADVRFGDVARLVAYEPLPAILDSASAADVTFYWQALASTSLPYTVFVHLVDEQTNMVVGYGDAEPGNGRYPTTGWLKGEYVTDPHTVLPTGAFVQGRPARIEIGLYDPATGQRLPQSASSDAFVLWRGRFGD